MLVFGLLVIIGVVIAVAVVRGKKSSDASFISFPCRVCQVPQNIAIAESVRRVGDAHAKGKLAELGNLKMPCMRCGTNQAADWMMQPRVHKMITDLDEGAFRTQTAAEYMNLASADGVGASGAPALSADLAQAAKSREPGQA